MTTVANTGDQELPDSFQTESKAKPLSVRRLMWLRFKRNRLARVGAATLSILYLSAIFAGFLAPYGLDSANRSYVSAPPHGLNFIDESGNFHLVPFVYGLSSSVDRTTFRRVYVVNTDEKYPLQFFVRGEPYRLFGIIETDVHLFGVEAPGRIFLFGTDPQGRDLFSRILYGAQVSLSVGLLGVTLTLIYGSVIGIASAYIGGLFDQVMQRLIELLLAFPVLPLWLALATLIPPTLPSDRIYFAISIVLSLVSWGGLARQTRSMALSLRETDYIKAALYANCSTWRIITRHLVPNTLSHIIVIATTTIPGMIIGETALSFLGLGIKPPLVSWGLLLNNAQETIVLLQQPWLLTPIIFVVITIIAFNFLGDGIRDAADPFGK
jgi:peptide/nickel transport system permease protein